MPKVEFLGVGRGKLCWLVDLKNVDEDSLIREIKRKKALMSNDITIHSGSIFAGFHTVGKVRILTVLVLGLMTLSACGGGDDEVNSQGVQKCTVTVCTNGKCTEDPCHK